MKRFLTTAHAARLSVALILAASFFIYSGCTSEAESISSPDATSSSKDGGSEGAKKKERAKIGYLGGQQERQTRGSSSE